MTAASGSARVLVVDDDAEVRDLIAEYIERDGLDVAVASGADEARRLLTGQVFDVVVVDVTMPGENGLSLSRFIRERLDIGIVIVTAADQPIDRIVGLAVGADDYVTKPFHPRELLMRVHVVLRRRNDRMATAGTGAPATFGRFRLDLAAHALRDATGRVVPLVSAELALLRAFAQHPRESLSRQQLIDLIEAGARSERRIDLLIARLRRKIEPEPHRPQLIRTVRSCGYMFVPVAVADGG